MSEISPWAFQQGGMVVILLLGFFFFFRFVVPSFQRLQEKHETALRDQIVEHRQRADSERAHFLNTMREMAESHKTTVGTMAEAHKAALSQVVHSVDKLAARIERRADAADKRDDAWRTEHKG